MLLSTLPLLSAASALAQDEPTTDEVTISIPLPPSIAATTIPAAEADEAEADEQLPATVPAPPTAAPPATAVAPASFAGQYGMLSERSIFLRNRPRPRPASAVQQVTSRPVAPPAAPERDFVLRGVVLEDVDLRAYVEDTRASRMLRLLPGEDVARGQIVQIEADAVLFQHDGEQLWIEVGQNFTGTRATSPLPQPTTEATNGSGGATTSTSTSASPSPPGGSATSIEERMRLRRQQSGGGRPTR
jgi:hypothetical protein